MSECNAPLQRCNYIAIVYFSRSTRPPRAHPQPNGRAEKTRSPPSPPQTKEIWRRTGNASSESRLLARRLHQPHVPRYLFYVVSKSDISRTRRSRPSPAATPPRRCRWSRLVSRSTAKYMLSLVVSTPLHDRSRASESRKDRPETDGHPAIRVCTLSCALEKDQGSQRPSHKGRIRIEPRLGRRRPGAVSWTNTITDRPINTVFSTISALFSREFLGFVLQSSMAEKITYGQGQPILNEGPRRFVCRVPLALAFLPNFLSCPMGFFEHVLGETGLDAGVDETGFFTAWITLPRASQLKR